jgi:hypothetical protein
VDKGVASHVSVPQDRWLSDPDSQVVFKVPEQALKAVDASDGALNHPIDHLLVIGKRQDLAESQRLFRRQ